MGEPIDTTTLRAAFVQAQSQMMNEGKLEPVVVISKDLALQLLDQIDRLTRERVTALESVVALSSWQRRAVIAIGSLRDELDPDDTDPIWSPLFDLLAEEFGDDDDDEGNDDHG